MLIAKELYGQSVTLWMMTYNSSCTIWDFYDEKMIYTANFLNPRFIFSFFVLLKPFFSYLQPAPRL